MAFKGGGETRVGQEIAKTIAERIRQAEANQTPIPPIKDDLNAKSIDDAYAVQQINTDHYLSQGRVISGRKIGLTAPSVQKQLGVDQPDFGVLWTDMEFLDGQEIPWSRLMQPKIEAEVALVLGEDIDHPDPGLVQLIQAVDYAVPALEIVGSRIADWKISIYDTIADNASSSLYVLGGSPTALDEIDLKRCGMVLEKEGQPVSTGAGAACMGSPLNAAVWLAKTLAKMQTPLSAGEVILTGALGPMVNVEPNDVFEARINGLGSVTARFSAAK